jgi:SAM-dependent methyltransferase
MLEEFRRRGVDVTGIDLSPRMIELARQRLGEGADVHVADMTDFDLGRTYDGAVSPINTLLQLTPDQLQAHLVCMAQHVPKYLVQVGLTTPDEEPSPGSHWEASRGGVSLRCDWQDEELDFVRGVSRQRSRIEIITGERAGEVIEEVHEMTLWTPSTWRDAIDASPFAEVATFDAGRRDEWPEVDRAATGGLLWHALARRPTLK